MCLQPPSEPCITYANFTVSLPWEARGEYSWGALLREEGRPALCRCGQDNPATPCCLQVTNIGVSGVPAAGIRTPLRLWLDGAKFSGLPSNSRSEFLFSTTAGELTAAAGTNGLQKSDRRLGWQHLNGALICLLHINYGM